LSLLVHFSDVLYSIQLLIKDFLLSKPSYWHYPPTLHPLNRRDWAPI